MFTYLLTLCLISGGFSKPTEVLLEYQDSIGQYSFGYSAPDSARSEVGSADGSVRGAFSYVDGAGVIQTAKYTADSEHGFRIEASNLPEAPAPAAEVIAATKDHLQALKAIQVDMKSHQDEKEIATMDFMVNKKSESSEIHEKDMNEIKKDDGMVIKEEASQSIEKMPQQVYRKLINKILKNAANFILIIFIFCRIRLRKNQKYRT